jgi:hypothetical protein
MYCCYASANGWPSDLAVIFALLSSTALIAVIAAAYLLLGRGEEDSGDPSSYHFIASLDIQDANEDDKPYSDIVVPLRSTTLPFDELLRIAEAMHLP